jgi:hypothetical protein
MALSVLDCRSDRAFKGTDMDPVLPFSRHFLFAWLHSFTKLTGRGCIAVLFVTHQAVGYGSGSEDYGRGSGYD